MNHTSSLVSHLPLEEWNAKGGGGGGGLVEAGGIGRGVGRIF